MTDHMGQSATSDTTCARRNAEEVVRRDETRLTEALLADAIGHLADAVDALAERLADIEWRAHDHGW